MEGRKILLLIGSILALVAGVYFAMRYQKNIVKTGNAFETDSIKLKNLFFKTIDFEKGVWNGKGSGEHIER